MKFLIYLTLLFLLTVYLTIVYSIVPEPVPLTVGAYTINHTSSARLTIVLDISCERQGSLLNILYLVRAVFELKIAFAFSTALATVIIVFKIIIY